MSRTIAMSPSSPPCRLRSPESVTASDERPGRRRAPAGIDLEGLALRPAGQLAPGHAVLRLGQ